MKRLSLPLATLILTSAVLASSPAKASEFECKTIYEIKIENMKDHKNLRKAAKIGTTIVVGFAAGVAITVLVTSLPIGIALIGVPVFGPLPGFFTYQGLQSLSKEAGINDAYAVQNAMERPYADIIEEVNASREELLARALEHFEIRLTHPSYVTKLVNDTNAERLAHNRPSIGQQEVVDQTRAKIIFNARHEPIRIVNAVSESLDLAKKLSPKAEKLTYEEWRVHMNANQKAFCPDGRAVTLKKATKNLLEDL